MLEARNEVKPSVHLAVAVPSNGVWMADFGLSLVQMFAYMSTSMFADGEHREVAFIDKRSSNLPRSRHECVEDAILKGCTHLLFIDSDQTFPHDTAHRLLAHKKQVVGANIALKTMPSYPTARARGSAPFGVPISSSAEKTGLEKVWRIGCGLVLVDLAIVRDIPRPWFSIEYDQKTGQFEGEDWYFMRKLEAAGAEIWIDHDLSKQVGHVGQFVYGHPHVPAIELEQAA